LNTPSTRPSSLASRLVRTPIFASSGPARRRRAAVPQRRRLKGNATRPGPVSPLLTGCATGGVRSRRGADGFAARVASVAPAARGVILLPAKFAEFACKKRRGAFSCPFRKAEGDRPALGRHGAVASLRAVDVEPPGVPAAPTSRRSWFAGRSRSSSRSSS
jgi:hypothetical protein